MLPWPRSLFLKFFLTFWLATLLAFVAGRFVMDWAGFGPRKERPRVIDVRPMPGARAAFPPGLGPPGAPPSPPSAPPPPGPGGQFFLLVPVISGVLSSLLASLALAWYLTKPLRHLHWGVDRVADGRFDTRIRPHMGRRRDELVDLADRFDHIDLIELLRDIAEDAGFEAASTGRRLSLQATGRFVAQVDGELLYRAFENVIRNAVKFTAPDTAIEVSANVLTDEAGRRLKVSVSDRGPGASDALLKAMFDPFVRGDNGTQGVGHGLGLAIARRAVRAHGGDIAARRREGGGLVIDIVLPERMPGHAAKGVQHNGGGPGSVA